jgi:hypothetical protein
MGEEAGRRDGGPLKEIRAVIDSPYGHDLHTKRVDSLAAATLGVMTGTSLAVAMIGQALAQARGLVTKHANKQVDRLLSEQRASASGRASRAGCRLLPSPRLPGLETDMRSSAAAGHQIERERCLVGAERHHPSLSAPGCETHGRQQTRCL